MCDKTLQKVYKFGPPVPVLHQLMLSPRGRVGGHPVELDT